MRGKTLYVAAAVVRYAVAWAAAWLAGRLLVVSDRIVPPALAYELALDRPQESAADQLAGAIVEAECWRSAYTALAAEFAAASAPTLSSSVWEMARLVRAIDRANEVAS